MSDQEYVDRRFAELMMRLGRVKNRNFASLFARLSRGLANQHSCLDLSSGDSDSALVQELGALPIVSTDGVGTPLVLEGTRLYMQRYHHYETNIARSLIEMNQPLADADPATCGAIVAGIFGSSSNSDQALAVLQALARRLTIIVGGPGTGKTTTVVRLLQALARQHGNTPFSIKLAAPTGKAAMRMKEAIREVHADAAPEVLTLHRLLGVRNNGRDFRYGVHNPLLVDLLIVDEVSMIDLAMMHSLLSALPPHARLVLLGDPDQLPSVEAGNILSDICKYPAGYTPAFVKFAGAAVGAQLPATADAHGLADAFCRLSQTHRFSPDRGIGLLSRQIREGSPVTLQDSEEVQYLPLEDFTTEAAIAHYKDYLDLISAHAGAEELLTAFDKVRILAPAREGDLGVEKINRDIEALLATFSAIDPTTPFYHGRPILVTRNDYNLRLFNGDAGICIKPQDTDPVVVFRDAAGQLRTYLASRLPPHETCFAMTVHKSQGSEFEHVVLVLANPASEQAAQIMTRELLYTAVTRARSRVSIYSDESAVEACLARRSVRHSGLGERFLTGEVEAAPRKGQLELFPPT